MKQESLSNVSIALTIYNEEGREMFTLANHISKEPFSRINKNNSIQCFVKKMPLMNGSYFCNIIAYKDGIVQDYIQEAYNLEVEEGDFYGTGKVIPTNQQCFLVDNEWQLK